MSNLKEIIEKVSETTKPVVVESMTNQANRLVELQSTYRDKLKEHFGTVSKYGEQHAKCDIWQEYAFLQNELGLNKGQINMIKTYSPKSIHIEYQERGERFIEGLAAKITNKVMKKEESVETVKLEYLNSGSGAWTINGNKTFSFENILAGGYNIQCLHVRTIFKYK